jgi:hypothetical protein
MTMNADAFKTMIDLPDKEFNEYYNKKFFSDPSNPSSSTFEDSIK